jgi:RNA polymerase sigma-70 factor, ECF subfamily
VGGAQASYRRFAPRIRLYGLRCLRDAAAAEDLTQDVLGLVLDRARRGELRDEGKLSSFVLGCARMTIKNIRRGARRREAVLAGLTPILALTAPAPDDAPDHAPLERCLEALPERERTIVVLAFYAERSSQETGEELGLTPGNVRVIRHRALTCLQKCLSRGGAS